MPPAHIGVEKLGAADKHTCNASHFTWPSIQSDSPFKKDTEDLVWDRVSCLISIGMGQRPKDGPQAHGLTVGFQVLQGLANDCGDSHRSMIRWKYLSITLYTTGYSLGLQDNQLEYNNVRVVEGHTKE